MENNLRSTDNRKLFLLVVAVGGGWFALEFIVGPLYKKIAVVGRCHEYFEVSGTGWAFMFPFAAFSLLLLWQSIGIIAHARKSLSIGKFPVPRDGDGPERKCLSGARARLAAYVALSMAVICGPGAVVAVAYYAPAIAAGLPVRSGTQAECLERANQYLSPTPGTSRLMFGRPAAGAG